jgi:hypothetical protein
VGTSGGLAHLAHPERVFDPVPLTVQLISIRREDQVYQAGQPIVLPWSAALLQIRVASSTLRNRSETIFKYRLDGLQQDWLESRNGTANFSALPAGRYTFIAMARNPALNAVSTTVMYNSRFFRPGGGATGFTLSAV